MHQTSARASLYCRFCSFQKICSIANKVDDHHPVPFLMGFQMIYILIVHKMVSKCLFSTISGKPWNLSAVLCIKSCKRDKKVGSIESFWTISNIWIMSTSPFSCPSSPSFLSCRMKKKLCQIKIIMPNVFFLCQMPQNYARSGIHYAKLRPLILSPIQRSEWNKWTAQKNYESGARRRSSERREREKERERASKKER